MTDHNDDQKLDGILQDWAQRRRQGTNLQTLEQRILEQLAKAPAPADEAQVTSGALARTPTSHTWSLWVSLGALVATLLIVCKIFLFPSGPENGMPPSDGDLPPQFAWLENSQLADKAALLREMDRVFDDRLQWVIETDGRVLLEVQNSNGNPKRATAHPAYMVRIVVARQDSHQSPWTPVWAADVVAHQEDLVRLTSESAGMPEGVELALWIYPVDDQVIAVDSDLALTGLPIELQFSGLQQPGVPLAVHASTEESVQYQVFQTVARLNGEA
jgi:hypothetical protein